MNRSFQGIWIPKILSDKCGVILATKLVADHLGQFKLSRDDREKGLRLHVLERTCFNGQEAVELIKRKLKQSWSYSSLTPNARCSWCKCSTFTLHSHHWPVKKCEGGCQTIDICPNCHVEYHFLTDEGLILLKSQYAEEIGRFMEEVQ